MSFGFGRSERKIWHAGVPKRCLGTAPWEQIDATRQRRFSKGTEFETGVDRGLCFVF